MHAVLGSNASPVDVLEYHEKKVKQKVAECIGAENYVKDHEKLSYADKLHPLELRAAYNDRVEKKVFHTSLQFGVKEGINNETMAAVGREYMQEMGMGEQPFLIYRHRDAAQEHIHLVSSYIDREGKWIHISRHALYRSFDIVARLARKYGLESSVPDLDDVPQALKHLHKGLRYLYPVMNRILEAVVPEYRYGDLDELNAVLRSHHIHASRGKEHTLTYKRQGLHYHPLNAEGQRVKEYLPARRFPSRPTLGNLEKRFVENAGLRAGHRESLAMMIDYALAGRSLSLGALKQALAPRKVSVVTGASSKGEDRIWYVDHSSKAVFEGSALGESYSFGAMQKRLVSEESYQQQLQEHQRQDQRHRPSL